MTSRYPNKIDNTASIPVVSDNVSPVRAANVNRLRSAILAIENELGVNPSDTFGTVKDRLDFLLGLVNADDGYIDATQVEIEDTDGYFVSSNVEGALAEIGADLASLSGGTSASSVSVADVDGYYVGTDVEAVLAELGTLKTDFISGHIETPENKIYYLVENLPYGGQIDTITTQADSGTGDGYVEINGTALGGGSNSLSSSEDVIHHSSSNSFAIGDSLTFAVTNNSSLNDLRFTVVFERD